MRGPRARIAASLLVWVASGCVNNYVVDDGSQGSSSSSSGASSSSSTTSSAGGSMGSGSSTVSGGGTTGTSGPAEPMELCQGPCVSDDACGGALDLCVQLRDGQEAMCLQGCGGDRVGGCPQGFSCLERGSVDGNSLLQCVPVGNECP